VSVMTDRRIIAVMTAVLGAGLLLRPEGYTSDSYNVAFDLMSPQLWGLLFVWSSIVSALRMFPRWFHFGTFIFVCFGWGLSLLAAVLIGEAESVAGAAWILGWGVMSLYAARLPHGN
jgi:hypothetical protein